MELSRPVMGVLYILTYKYLSHHLTWRQGLVHLWLEVGFRATYMNQRTGECCGKQTETHFRHKFSKTELLYFGNPEDNEN